MNYEDERIKRLETEKTNKLTESNSLYDNLISDNQKMLDEQNSWQDTYLQQQNDLYDRGLKLTTDKLNQGKKAVEEGYQKEALASESSYQDYINPYGVNAEQQAETGMTNTGYSESTKTSAYNTARIRTALARSAAIKANTEYDNQIAEASLNNDSQKATLALEILKEKLANRLTAFQTELGLKQNKLSGQTDIDNTYYNRYQDVFNQQNYEKEQAENLRRYQEELAYQKERDRISDEQWQKQYELSKNSAYSSGGSGYSLADSTPSYQVNTPYYQGDLNPDAKYGTFSNGYQPNNIGGVKLSSSKKTVSQMAGGTGNANSSGVNVDNQTVWKLNGKYYIWNGSKNKYEQVSF